MEPLQLFMTSVLTPVIVTLLIYAAGLSKAPLNASFAEVCARGLHRVIYALLVACCVPAITLVITAIIHLLES